MAGTRTPGSGSGVDRLLAFHEEASQAGDEAALEWARRQLEDQRPRVFAEDDAPKPVAAPKPKPRSEYVARRLADLAGAP